MQKLNIRAHPWFKPRHVTKILDRLGEKHSSIQVARGEADILANQIQNLRREAVGNRRQLPAEVTSTFSKGIWLPKPIAAVEEPRTD